MVKCSICGKEYSKKGIGTHNWRAHGDGKDFDPNRGYKNKSRKAWNKGLTKDVDDRVMKYSESLKEGYKTGTISHSGIACKNYDIEKRRINGAKGGGYREKSGRSKGGYKTDSDGNKAWLQSSYELKCADILNDLGIKWIRPKFLKYTDDAGKVRKYFPDFFLLDYDLYLDPKNDYLALKDKHKIELVKENNNVEVIIITNNQLNKEFMTKIRAYSSVGRASR